MHDIAARLTRLEREVRGLRRQRVVLLAAAGLGIGLACHTEKQEPKELVIGQTRISGSEIVVGGTRISTRGITIERDAKESGASVMIDTTGISINDAQLGRISLQAGQASFTHDKLIASIGVSGGASVRLGDGEAMAALSAGPRDTILSLHHDDKRGVLLEASKDSTSALFRHEDRRVAVVAADKQAAVDVGATGDTATMIVDGTTATVTAEHGREHASLVAGNRMATTRFEH